jgi:2-polyprenyl-3-methyl-5-hydroxy-6-metoxy-1,4-benzoquinol methylase
MALNYAPLASWYEQLGMAAFAESITPKLVQYAQAHDWIGRRMLDAGCGTGGAARWLASKGYTTIALDLSTEMLAAARQRFPNTGFSITWQQGDLRTLENIMPVDMILALDVLNELNGLRDIETFLSRAQQLLEPSKMLIFDLHTIEGLVTRAAVPLTQLHNDGALVVNASQQFDYERLILTTSYDIFQKVENGWQRSQTTILQRGFPIQAVTALLQRFGFHVQSMFNSSLDVYDPASSRAKRVIIAARRH